MYASYVVQDLAGLGLSHMYTPAIETFKKVLTMDQNNYPDTLKALPPNTGHLQFGSILSWRSQGYFVINAPALVTAGWSMVKPLLDAR